MKMFNKKRRDKNEDYRNHSERATATSTVAAQKPKPNQMAGSPTRSIITPTPTMVSMVLIGSKTRMLRYLMPNMSISNQRAMLSDACGTTSVKCCGWSWRFLPCYLVVLSCSH